MSKYVCERCKHSFSSSSALNKHKNLAKYCLKVKTKKQDDVEEVDTEPGTLICEYCAYSTKIKANFERHRGTCKLRPIMTEEEILEEVVEEQQKIIRKLEEKVEKLESLDKTHLKTIKDLKDEIIRWEGRMEGVLMRTKVAKISKQKKPSLSNVAPLTRKTVDDNIDLFDEDLFKKGNLGIAEFIIRISDNGDSFYWADLKRKIFVRTDEDGNEIKEDISHFIDEVLDSLRKNAGERLKILATAIWDPKIYDSPKDRNDAVERIKDLTLILEKPLEYPSLVQTCKRRIIRHLIDAAEQKDTR